MSTSELSEWLSLLCDVFEKVKKLALIYANYCREVYSYAIPSGECPECAELEATVETVLTTCQASLEEELLLIADCFYKPEIKL